MDGSTYGKSSLRFVKRAINKKASTSPTSLDTNPRAARRRKIHLERRNKQLKEFWRFLIFSCLTYVLGSLYVINGWSVIDVEQIHVKGSARIQPKEIVHFSGLEFPNQLLSINQNELKKNLLKELPIKSIQIRRHLIPPGLEIEIKERKPIAYANKRGINGIEDGMIDEDGNWMPIKMATNTSPPIKEIYVEGWMEIHQSWITIILNNEKRIGSSLQKIIVSPNGELSLQTNSFETINLGANSFKINAQINALNQLTKTLPQNFVNQPGTILDIRDPSKPELQIPTIK